MELICGACHIICTDHIILDRLVRTVLHERHMLMRRSMIYDIRMISLKYILNTLLVTHGCNQCFQIQFRIFFLQLQLYIISIVLIDVYYDELLRLVQRHLAADLASNRAPASGHKDDLVSDIVPDFLHVEIHRLSSEKIFDTYVPQHGDVDLLIDHLIDPGEHLDLACCLLTDVKQLSALLVIQCGNRDDDLLDIITLCHLRNALFTSHDGNPLEIGADLARVIVYDARDFSVQMLAVLHFSDEHVARCARSDDHRHH